MNTEYRLQQIEDRLNSLTESFLQSQRNNVNTVNRLDANSNKVNALTPYKETKQAYYGETEKTFYDVPDGNISVFFSNYNGNYSINRNDNRVTVSFDALYEHSDISIMIQ